MLTNSLNLNSIILVVVCAGLLFNAINRLRTGSAILAYSQYSRSENPKLFWVAIAVSFGFGLGLLLDLLFRFSRLIG